jgi:hypothetical protein
MPALSPYSKDVREDEVPVAIECRWFTSYSRNPFDDHDDYTHVITWADGSTEERRLIPREWNAIAAATHLRKLDEANAKMAGEHEAGRVGTTEIAA